jgi:hypothetical protein
MLFGSGIIEFALSLIFFYYLLSLLTSSANELISSFLDWRAQELVKGIRDLLNFPMAEGTTTLPPDTNTVKSAKSVSSSPKTLGDMLLAHPLVKGLATEPYRLRQLLIRRDEHPPSYIPDRVFSMALLDILANAQARPNPQPSTDAAKLITAIRTSLTTLPTDLRHALGPLLNTADDLDLARRNLEDWFNAKMERVSGSYKRWTQYVLFLLGFLITVGLNADSFAVGQQLWNTPVLRQMSVAQVDQRLAAGEPTATNVQQEAADAIKQVQAELQQVLVFPIGWGPECIANTTTDVVRNPSNCIPTDWQGWLAKLAGWLVTTLAISFGAPFWFDLLRKVSHLRSTGPAPNADQTETAS